MSGVRSRDRRPAPAPLCRSRRAFAGRGELLPDDAQGQELVPLEPQDLAQPLHVVLGEEAIAAVRALRLEEALILEVADLRDRDVRELLLQAAAHRADRQRPRGARLGDRGHCLALQEGQLVLADLHLVTVLEDLRVDPPPVDERAVQGCPRLRSRSRRPGGEGARAVARPSRRRGRCPPRASGRS